MLNGSTAQRLNGSKCLPSSPVCYPSARMDEPEYLICLQCETPTYQFEYANGKIATIVCTTCGNDDVTEFMTEAELEELS